MTKTSHKQNRPFDFKLINLVEPYPVLYQRQLGLSTYEYMKAKTEIWKEIAAKMGADVKFCISRWGNLRCQFTKEFRQCRYLCPKLGVIRGSTWPYLERLKFLESTVQFNRPKRERIPKRKKKPTKKETEWNNHVSCEDDKSVSTQDSRDDEEYITDILAEDEPLQEERIYSDDIFIDSNELTSEKNASASNVQKMTTLFNGMDTKNRVRAERRIMAFLCKCQLKALINEGVDDLDI